MGILFHTEKKHYQRSEEWTDYHWLVDHVGLFPSRTAQLNFGITKKRDGFKCNICQKSFPKNSRCIFGKSYYRPFCINCAVDWFNNSITTLNNLIGKFKENKKTIEDNKEQWTKEMVVNSL